MSNQNATNQKNKMQLTQKMEEKKSFSKRLAEGANNFKDVSESLKSISENLGNPINKLSSFFTKKKNTTTPKEEKTNNSFVEDKASHLPANESVLSVEITSKEKNEEPSQEILVRTDEDPFTQLEDVLNPVNIGEKHDKALTKAIESQLKILSVIRTPTLLGQTYNLILSAINDSITLAQTKEEKENYQRNAGLMLHSLVFFQEAQLSYEENNHNKESEQLLDMAVDELQQSVTSVALCAITGGIGGAAVAAKKISAKIVIEKACLGIKNSNFISHFFKHLFKKKQLEQQRKEFYHFLVAVFDKLNRYRKNFGNNQIILAEMINDYREKIIEDAGDKTEELKRLAEQNGEILNYMPVLPSEPSKGVFAKAVSVVIPLVVMLGVDGYMIQNYFSQSPILVTLASVAVCIVMAIALIVSLWTVNGKIKRRQTDYQNEITKYHREVADYYYKTLADFFRAA